MSPAGLSTDAGRVLLPLARAAIAARLRMAGPAPAPQPDWLDEERASFVTLVLGGALRGCMGSLRPQRALREDVARNSRAAAFRDPRFSSLTVDEYAQVQIEVSVLSKPVPMQFTDRDETLALLRPGIDGVILRCGRKQATFLPQVWQQLGSAEQFMGALLGKAGLPADRWNEGIQLARYQVQAFAEHGDDGPGRRAD